MTEHKIAFLLVSVSECRKHHSQFDVEEPRVGRLVLHLEELVHHQMDLGEVPLHAVNVKDRFNKSI